VQVARRAGLLPWEDRQRRAPPEGAAVAFAPGAMAFAPDAMAFAPDAEQARAA
jgi:hypothetical protein